jgi:hypothetical protein
MEVDGSPPSRELVLGELKALRKLTNGASVAGVSSSPTICRLLGNGDPLVAWSRLQHLALDTPWSRDVEAACYSLGFASNATTHLARLEEFAAAFYVDQRQARRYSDRGLLQLAQVITTNWVLDAVPSLDIVLTPCSPSEVVMYARASTPEVVGMQLPRLEVIRDNGEQRLDVEYVEEPGEQAIGYRFAQPITVEVIGETSIVIRWSGELWPKFSVQISGTWPTFTPIVETLGAKAMVRLIPTGLSSASEERCERTEDARVEKGGRDQ